MAEDRKPLEYDRSGPAHVTRGQFRILLLLLLIHSVIYAQSTYAPGVTAFVHNWWAQRKEAAAQAARVKQTLALERQAMTFTRPPTVVVWDENPGTAAKLLRGIGYHPINIERLNRIRYLDGFPEGAAADEPPVLSQLFQFRFSQGPFRPAVVFLGGLRSPAGNQRLIRVEMEGYLDLVQTIELADSDPRVRGDKPWTGNVEKFQQLAASAFIPAGGVSQPLPIRNRAPAGQLLLHPAEERFTMPLHWTPPDAPGHPGNIRVEYRDQLRLFAGQSDPADASHFTIPYDLDATPGVIDGWLRDNDTIDLTPRTGTVVNHRWYPHAK